MRSGGWNELSGSVVEVNCVSEWVVYNAVVLRQAALERCTVFLEGLASSRHSGEKE